MDWEGEEMTSQRIVPTEGRWIFTCGCGNEIRLKDAGFIASAGGCPHCWVDGYVVDGCGVSDGLVASELGWCGCGQPEDIDDAMIELLQSALDQEAEDGHPGIRLPEKIPMDRAAWMLLSYIADEFGWTEHGGSIFGAWITDRGRTALSNLRLYQEPQVN
jgi:hypothetical protein